MSKKRVHEIAKEHGISSKELLEKLSAAGVAAKAAASSVEEADALRVLGTNGSSPTATAPAPSPPPTPAPTPPPAAPPAPDGQASPAPDGQAGAAAQPGGER